MLYAHNYNKMNYNLVDKMIKETKDKVNNDYFEREQKRNIENTGSIDGKPPYGYDSWGTYWKAF